MSNKYQFELKFIVRDYECDLQGIVNNAVYQNYLEHARHEFLFLVGLDFAKMHKEGLDAVVSRIEIDYKFPLKSRDEFTVKINIERQGKLRFIFWQDIFRLPDNKLILKAKVEAVCLQNGKLVIPDKILKAFENYFKNKKIT